MIYSLLNMEALDKEQIRKLIRKEEGEYTVYNMSSYNV